MNDIFILIMCQDRCFLHSPHLVETLDAQFSKRIMDASHCVDTLDEIRREICKTSLPSHISDNLLTNIHEYIVAAIEKL